MANRRCTVRNQIKPNRHQTFQDRTLLSRSLRLGLTDVQLWFVDIKQYNSVQFSTRGRDYSPLLQQSSSGGLAMPRILSCSSGSRAVGLMVACCRKMAQHIGVAKVRMRPRRPIWRGAAAQGARFRAPRWSSLFITSGIKTIPGATNQIMY